MSGRPRRNHSASFKAKVAIEALTDGKTIAEIAQKPACIPTSHGVGLPAHRDRAADAGERLFWKARSARPGC